MRPPAGVECVLCRRDKQHRCQAQIYVDGEPFCLPCADGDPCVVDRVGGAPAWMSAEVEAGMFEVETAPAPVIHRAPEELGFSVVVEGSVGTRFLTDEEFAVEKRKAFEMAAAVRRREGQRGKERRLPVPRMVEPKRRGGSLPGRTVTFPPKDLERRSEEMTARNVAKGEATRAKAEGLLGAVIDRVVAAEVGVSPSRVAQLRKDKGIAAVVSSNSRPGEKRTEAVMDEMREAVKKLGGTMTDSALGKQLGVSGSRVGQLRKELGIAAMKPGRKPAEGSAKKTKPAKGPLVLSKIKPELGALLRAGANVMGGDMVRVSIEMTPAQACERFAQLSPEQMGSALEAAMKIAVRG